MEYQELVSPREWDNLGTMVCFHRKYNLGDKHDFKDTTALDKFLKSKEVAAFLPLYLYDHSGITMATTPFHCKWDSGQVGYIYATKAQAETWGVKGKHLKERLQAEVAEYDEYLMAG